MVEWTVTIAEERSSTAIQRADHAPFACRARYQLALEEIDNKHYDQAQDILLQNLELTGPVFDGLYEYCRRAMLLGREPG